MYGGPCRVVILAMTRQMFQDVLAAGPYTSPHFDTQRKHFLRDELGGVTVTRRLHKTAQGELISGQV